MLQIHPLSSLEKVFLDETPTAAPFTGCSCLQKEVVSFQVAFRSDTDTDVTAQAEGDCALFWVVNIPCALPCYEDSDTWYLRKTAGFFPDLLRPATAELHIKAGQWHSLWVSCQGSGNIKILLNGQAVTVKILRLDAVLPPQTLRCTNWFHCDCIAQAYRLSPWSEPYWTALERYFHVYAAHGLNMLLTPLFTPPLDTEIGGERLTTQLVGVTKTDTKYGFDFSLLQRWVDLAQHCGIRYFELSHLFTQWGARSAPKILCNGKALFGWHTDAQSAEYTEFLTQFAAALNQFLEQRRITEQCYLHVSDEPGIADIAVYARHASLIRALFPKLKMIDALSDFPFYQEGLVERPIPAVNHIAPFIGNVPELWTYYCCGQHKDGVPNRFFAMPSYRNRILGVLLWKFRCAGFLQWGFNFWNNQYSKAAVDPYTCSDAGGAFPSGDAYVVYPAADGAPLPSLRLKVFHEALQDMRALQLLESKISYASTLRLAEQGLACPLQFNEFPRNAQWILQLRERVNQALKE
ncbi:MAG: DUF4091 domain-containing protein [Oscillospiraceae bacterium]|jgi:hypothetical protein|nr:DUF4091 domain-containing protein [Oscillospiraceae bacterium]